MPGHRKKPFSSKQKRQQLKEKREKKRDNDYYKDHPTEKKDEVLDELGEKFEVNRGGDKKSLLTTSTLMNVQPVSGQAKYNPNRYRLQFRKESKAEIEKQKKEAAIPIDFLPEESLEMDVDDVYRPGSVFDMPKRPPWDYKMSATQLQMREEQYFEQYCHKIVSNHDAHQLSYFEMNLETWRQLWRVLELSDIVLLITDIRHPALHFSPTMYDYVTRDMKKHLILVLNKIDLVPPAIVTAWKHYFKMKFPGIHVITFTSIPKDKEEMGNVAAKPENILHKRRRLRRRAPAVGPKELWSTCDHIVQGKVDLQSWKEKIEEDMLLAGAQNDDDDGNGDTEEHDIHIEPADTSYSQHEQYKNGVLTIGCCGYPNVGKSSLMNGLMGKKVVSVSKTPGHTKHFQTIFLTPTVKLCDSPGLVFPSLICRPMQVLSGIYPVSQVREPYSAIQYLTARLPLPKLLQLTHPDASGPPGTGDAQQHKWSAFDICEAWAVKKGFVTPKIARPDMYRAANSILRMVVDGRLTLCMRPPGFFKDKDKWESNEETTEIALLQHMHRSSGAEQRPQGELLEEREDTDTSAGTQSDDDQRNGDYGSSDDDVTGATNREKGRSAAAPPMASSNPFTLLDDDE